MAGISKETVADLEQQLAAERERSAQLQSALEERDASQPGSMWPASHYNTQTPTTFTVYGDTRQIPMWTFEVKASRISRELDAEGKKVHKTIDLPARQIRCMDESEAKRLFSVTEENGKARKNPLDPSRWTFDVKCLEEDERNLNSAKIYIRRFMQRFTAGNRPSQVPPETLPIYLRKYQQEAMKQVLAEKDEVAV